MTSELMEQCHHIDCFPITSAKASIFGVASWLAGATSTEQATFFNEFDSQLRRNCDITKGSMGVAMQCYNITKDLTDDAQYTLIDIGTP